jgi:2,3-dihydroxybenzoate-AMP ligase
MLEGFVPWPDELASQYRRKGYWRDISIPQLFANLVTEAPRRIVVIDGQRRISLAELWLQSERLAAHLYSMGLRSGQRAVFQLPNSAEFLSTFLALLRIGVIPVMALPAHREAEIAHYVKSAEAVALLIPDQHRGFDYRSMADSVRRATGCLRQVLVLGLPGPHDASVWDLLSREAPADAVSAITGRMPEPTDVALMLLSGGTTALPKLIPRTHNDYVYNFQRSASVAGFDRNTVLLMVLPLAHNYNLGSPGMLGALAAGGSMVIAPKADAATVFSLVEKEQATTIPAAVPLVANWLNDPVIESFDLRSLRLVQNGGARMPPELRNRLRQRLGCIYQEVYGTAEGLLNLTRLDDDDDKILNSSGTPICEDDEIKVVDEDGREVPDGDRGELITRGPYTVRGYYNAPAINVHAFTADGFYRMGDVVIKKGRYIYVEGRKGDLINRGGEKISIDEVENLILKHPAVHSVALVAMPDPIFGEKGCAFVVLKPSQSLTFEALSQFLIAQKIARFKLPERLEILPEFPISPAGKIMRRTLREMIEAKLRSEKPG